MLAANGGSITMIIWIVIIFAFMYFMMIRPQQKEQKQKTAMVEFGSNKNCRIPMSKSAISQVEKPEDAARAADESKNPIEQPEKKGLFGRKKD